VTVRLTVSYRGGRYAGWQRQDNAVAVQQVLEEALSDLMGGPVRAIGASRTDAGVHARGQVVHLDPAEGVRLLPLRALVHGTNHRLPADVRVLAAGEAPEGFHARKHAEGKEYVYRLVRLARMEVLSPLDALFAVAAPERIDVGRMTRAAGFLPGRHDFSAFALAGGSHGQPFRTIASAVWSEAGPGLSFAIVGDGFLRGMVRALVGTLIEVGLGRRTPEDFAALLSGRPRSEAGPTAPACGLTLEQVYYPPRPPNPPPGPETVVVP
jgi:tRNA pseudouridine38-40 synthase